MSFDSFGYAIFLATVLAAAAFLRRYQIPVLVYLYLLASLIFYAFAGWIQAILFVTSILVNQTLMERIQANEGTNRRNYWILGLIFNLNYLLTLKYAAFLEGAWGSLGASIGLWRPPATLVDVLLPLGISFYTFESLSILTDVYRRRLPAPSLRNHALFVGFFPHLIAGPIMRGRDLLPQFENLDSSRKTPAWDRGISFLAVGFFKKVVLADCLALYVDPVFNKPDAYGALTIWFAAVAFAFQIFFDFSGYSDMAEGSAALLGLRLVPNFRGPYAATSLQDFWRRWHISLSTWLRDYLYFPLGGSREGPARAYLALFMTMLLGGLWHGAHVTFLIWGAYHGLLLVLERAAGLVGVPARDWQKPFRWAYTALAVLIGWVLFRADSFDDAVLIYYQAIWGRLNFSPHNMLIVVLIALCAVFAVLEARWSKVAWGGGEGALTPVLAGLLLAAALLFKVALSSVEQPFIYFRF